MLSETNTKRLTQADPEKQAQARKARRPLLDTFMRRSADKSFKWMVTLFPTEAYAMDADMSLASQAWDNANIRQLEELLENHWPRPGEEDLRGFEWYFAWRLANESRLTLRDGGTTVAFSPDGKLLATDSVDEKVVKLRDLSTGRQLAALPARAVYHLVFSPDGRYLAAAGGAGNGVAATLWDLRQQQRRID